ncbi:MAG: helix-turn-helix transcriptional regulator [Bacteroidetes bacterium]|nr:helix-turn-helix transcriptional regulator [Bacteroidota bacterium]
MKREELIRRKEYWITKIQIDLFNELTKFLKENKWTKAKFAEELGVTKSYVSQILNGDFDHKISKLVELSLAIKKAPVIKFVDLNVVDNRVKQVAQQTVVFVLEKNSVRQDFSRTIKATKQNDNYKFSKDKDTKYLTVHGDC